MLYRPNARSVNEADWLRQFSAELSHLPLGQVCESRGAGGETPQTEARSALVRVRPASR